VILTYRGNGLTIGGDDVIPFHPLEYLTRLPHTSNPWAGFGSALPPIFSLPPIPDTLLFFLFSPFGIYLANKLYVFVLSTLTILSVHFLAVTIFHENVHKDLIGIVAACAYVLNPLIFADTYKTMVFAELSLVQTGFVFFLIFTIKYFQTAQVRNSFYSGLASFLMLSFPGLSSYRMAFLATFSYISIAAYYLACHFKTKLSRAFSDIFKGVVIVAIVSFVLNSYWLIPFIQNAGYFSSFSAGFQTTTVFNAFSTMPNTLRLMNSWSFYSGFVPYASVFLENPIVIALTFAWPLFAFMPFLSKKVIKDRKTLVMCLVTVLTILLACGSEYPLGQTYMIIINAHVGPYYFLRPFYNTGAISSIVLTLEYALLIGLFSSSIYSWFIGRSCCLRASRRKIAATFGPVLIVIILASSSWPIITGDVMRNWYSPDQYGVRIPDSYWETNEYLENICNLNQRALLLPSTQVYVGTLWGYQGTSQFYNLMFNSPLITGNEVPYGIGSNKTLIDEVYSIYYGSPSINNTLDITQQIDEVIRWQSDKAIWVNNSLQIDFNSTYQIGKWHQVELKLPFASNWSDFTHIIIQFTAELNLDDLQIGIGDANGFGGWWTAESHVYQLNDGTFIPMEAPSLPAQDSESTTLLLDLEKPDVSRYSIDSVTSVWIQYFVRGNSGEPRISANKMLLAKLSPDTSYYAGFLASVKIKYLLVDLSIKDGAKSDPRFWLDMLSSSDCFKLIWQKDTLYIFENAYG
jgi:hypothetical protein